MEFYAIVLSHTLSGPPPWLSIKISESQTNTNSQGPRGRIKSESGGGTEASKRVKSFPGASNEQPRS